MSSPFDWLVPLAYPSDMAKQSKSDDESAVLFVRGMSRDLERKGISLTLPSRGK